MEQTNNNNKVNVNDKCYCGSNKKYKKCCLSKDVEAKYKESLYNESEMMIDSLTILRAQFPNITFKDVSDKLTTNTYKELQIKHFRDNVCLVAERTERCEAVFNEREKDAPDSNYTLLLMYHGSYRILHGGNSLLMYMMSLKSFF